MITSKIEYSEGDTAPLNFEENDENFEEDDGSTMARFDIEEMDEAVVKEVPKGWKAALFYFQLCSFWLGYNALMTALVSVVWPSQIGAIVGDADKEKYNGFIPVLGALASVVTTPISGYISDFSTHKRGKRRPFILSGAFICVLFLIACMPFSQGSDRWSVYLLMVSFLGIQFGINWAGGPYAGLMPDLVPERSYGLGSGVMALFTALGSLIGVITAGLLTNPSNYVLVYSILGAFLLFSMIPTLYITEIPRVSRPQEVYTIKAFLKSLYLPADLYKDFYWVLLTRFLEDMGIYAVLPFFQFFLKDIIHVDKPELYASVMVGLVVITSVPSSIISGPLADKYGRKLMVYISSSIMTIVLVLFIILSFNPSLTGTLLSAALFGIGYGSYSAVDWALALSVLPQGTNIAKDMGIWHCTFVIPTIFSPMITGFILSAFKKTSLFTGYIVVFSLAGLWFILCTVFIYPVKNPLVHAKR
eukprot:TRINITY_DN3073_c0_g2_i1.p1 TRINITY_DN3073_c0_g2~~TRINITY_DN3073_c0_g2_i1.p1  ORF type:complete len:474 (-),score=69.80 TRINITY_DN3073_c0_g2_i1:37-1458(-)